MDFSIIIPAKNEEHNVIPLIEEIIMCCSHIGNFEILYIDDGSDDNTYLNSVKMRVKYGNKVRPIKHQTCSGQSKAIYTGVTYATGKYIITLDADGQNDPSDIPLMVSDSMKYPVGTDFCIAGYRKRRKDSLWKKLQSKIANRIRTFLFNDGTPDTGCGLKVIPRQTYLNLPYFDHMHRYLPALIKKRGGSISIVETNHRNRQFGISKYNMRGRLKVGIFDLIGVFWLNKRYTNTLVSEYQDEQ